MRLAHERELEFHAERLATAVRLAPNDSVRTRNAQALTLKLAEIFELKQQNRRQEIALFEVELEQLRARLEKRADYKQELIRKRFTGLTGLTVNSEP